MKPPSNQILWALGGVGLLVLATARAGLSMPPPPPPVTPDEPPSEPPDANPTPPGSPPPGKTSCGYPAPNPVSSPPKTNKELIDRLKVIIKEENPSAEGNAKAEGYVSNTPYVDALADAIVRSAKLYRIPVDFLAGMAFGESTFNFHAGDALIRKQRSGTTGCKGIEIGPLQIKISTAAEMGFCFVKWLPANGNYWSGDLRTLIAVQAGAKYARWCKDYATARGFPEWCHAYDVYNVGPGNFSKGKRSPYIKKVADAANRYSQLRL